MAVEHRHGPESLQVRQGLRAIIGAPPPLGIHGPERNVRKDDDRRTALDPLDIFREPFELVFPEAAKAARLQIDDVDETDEMHAILVEAVPACALRALAESLQITLARVTDHVVLAGHIE